MEFWKVLIKDKNYVQLLCDLNMLHYLEEEKFILL